MVNSDEFLFLQMYCLEKAVKLHSGFKLKLIASLCIHIASSSLIILHVTPSHTP